jgi:NAD(P)-dependent dehydrogenase (short-subunit alcohol dehydrogenase family)
MLPFSTYDPKVVLVTGAGRGLGREMVLTLVGRGIKVGALGRTEADLQALVGEAPGGMVQPLLADVSDPASLKAAFGELDAGLGKLDALINNAAVYPHRDFLDETPESFAHTMDINLGGIVACSMLALERFLPLGMGRIVNVATFAGNNPTYLSSAYSVSKAAARVLTRAMVKDLGDRFPDIVINDWIPGALNTSMGIPEGHDPKEAAKWGVNLTLMHDPEINGLSFNENREDLPLLSLKKRVFYKLTGQTPEPRRLD